MKKAAGILLALVAIWGISRLPHPAVDVGKLEPVELVLLERTEQGIRIETESGAKGEGRTLAEAAENLQAGASREIFLETADKLLLRGDLTGYWQEIWELFRPDCRVCRVEQELDLMEAAEYLSVHEPEQTLGKLRSGMGIVQTLYPEGRRNRLE